MISNKNTIKLLLGLVLFFGIPSCEKSPCTGATTYNAKITNIKTDIVNKRIGESWVNYNGESISPEDSFSIYFQIDYRQIAQRKTKEISFSNNLFACEPAYIPLLNQEFKSLTITSNNDFNDDFPKGANLVPIFELYSLNGQFFNLLNYLKTNPKEFINNSSRLYFAQNPSKANQHILTFELETTDTILVSQTPILNLK